MGKKSKKSNEKCSVLLSNKTYIKRIRQRFGLSKYQMLWITFGKGLVIGADGNTTANDNDITGTEFQDQIPA